MLRIQTLLTIVPCLAAAVHSSHCWHRTLLAATVPAAHPQERCARSTFRVYRPNCWQKWPTGSFLFCFASYCDYTGAAERVRARKAVGHRFAVRVLCANRRATVCNRSISAVSAFRDCLVELPSDSRICALFLSMYDATSVGIIRSHDRKWCSTRSPCSVILSAPLSPASS